MEAALDIPLTTHTGHFENVPFNNSTLRSVYHIRDYDVTKLMHLPLTDDPSVFISHDWPISIARHGDTRGLIRRKPYFKDEVSLEVYESLDTAS